MIGLSAKIEVRDLIKLMADEMGVTEAQWSYHEKNAPNSPLIVSVPKHKSRLALYPTSRNLIALLDIAKVADTVLFVMDHSEVIDSYGAALLSALMAQGLPTVMGAIVGLENVNVKQRSDARKSATKTFQQKFTTEPRILAIEGQSDVANLVRYLCVSHVRQFWRNQRSYMLPVGVHYTPNEEDSDNPEFGTLHLTGHIRGENFDPNNLVHLTGIGDFQVLGVASSKDPYFYDKRGPIAYSESLTLEDRELPSASQVSLPNAELQETLISTNDVDEMQNEQTWPTEHDMLHAEQLKARRKILAPKGMSAYQAQWLIPESDDDEEDGEDGAADEGDGDGMDADGNGDGGGNGEEGMDMDGGDVEEGDEEESFESEEEEEMVEIDDKETQLIKKLEADAEELKKARLVQLQAEKKRRNLDLEINEDEIEMDFDFPDEVDVPEGKLAQDEFRDYRGLQSFKSSAWDPFQNLPRDYGMIFRIPNFEATRKKVLKAAELAVDPVHTGEFVTIHLKDVHRSVMDSIDPHAPLVVSSLLIFENKFSVMHYAVTKSLNYEPIVKTGESLLFHVGFRRFTGSTLFTEDTKGSTKYKMEKMLHPSRGCIATVYAPITFPHQPVLVWKMDEHGVPCLAASGSVRTCDPNRIIVKKIVLTGHPMSIEKRKVVVTGMFHHPDDVRYYAKAELVTKSGVRGQIREPLGTKGLFKCVFGDRINNGDTVCLNLYKRVFPNWVEVDQPPRTPGTITVAPPEDLMEAQ